MITTHRLKLISLAVLLSGATVVVSQQWLSTAVRKATAQARADAPATVSPAVRVLVAAAPLPAGATIKPGALRWQEWPNGASTAAYLTAANTQLGQFDGAVVRSALVAGEPIAPGVLLKAGEGGVLAAVLAPGYRAVTINVTAASAVAGFIMPDDRVDLILSREATGNAANPSFVSETVLSDVRVLGSDQRGGEAKQEVVAPQTVTLEVTPKGAEVIAVAEQMGKLSLSLRSLATGAAVPDRPPVTRTSSGDATQSTITALARPRRVAAAQPSVEIVRGGAQ